jgi:hypothetical protein
VVVATKQRYTFAMESSQCDQLHHVSVKYRHVSLSLCIMLRNRLLRIRYLRRKYEGDRHNHRRSSCDAASNKPLHDHGWCGVNNASAVALMMNLSPPPWAWQLLLPWHMTKHWRSDPQYHHLSLMKTLCVWREWKWMWNELNSWSGGIYRWTGMEFIFFEKNQGFWAQTIKND